MKLRPSIIPRFMLAVLLCMVVQFVRAAEPSYSLVVYTVDGVRTAYAFADRPIMTIEGISATEKGKIITEAFADGGAVQCGFCIPGMVIATYYLLSNNPDPTEEEIRLGLSGNICRCTGYDLIVESIRLAAKRGEALWKK